MDYNKQNIWLVLGWLNKMNRRGRTEQMRMIHCADLHIDSRLTANLRGEKRKERQTEILHSFRRMVRYAAEHQVEAILIAGDLFDSNFVSASAGNMVWQEITEHSEICFYYLKGNHDREDFFQKRGEIPGNLKLFSDSWCYYFQPCRRGQIVIAGAELNGANADMLSTSLYLHPDSFNIVMLHGQESEYGGSESELLFPLRRLRGRHIDYLALGHIHQFKQERLDSRGIWCYSGCLEGRGFDECGEHGFVLLDIEEETGICHSRLIPFAQRSLYRIEADVTGCLSTGEMEQKVREAVARTGCSHKSLLRISLTGQVDVSAEKNLLLLTQTLEEDYYFVKIYDRTEFLIDEEEYAWDPSLKGEFIRCIAADNEIAEEEKAALIRYGIQALAGEEIE